MVEWVGLKLEEWDLKREGERERGREGGREREREREKREKREREIRTTKAFRNNKVMCRSNNNSLENFPSNRQHQTVEFLSALHELQVAKYHTWPDIHVHSCLQYDTIYSKCNNYITAAFKNSTT